MKTVLPHEYHTEIQMTTILALITHISFRHLDTRQGAVNTRVQGNFDIARTDAWVRAQLEYYRCFLQFDSIHEGQIGLTISIPNLWFENNQVIWQNEQAKTSSTELIPTVTDYIPHSQIAQVKSGNLPFKIWIVLNSGVIYYTDRFVVVPGKGIEGDFELLDLSSTGESKQAEARIVEVKIQDSNEYGGMGLSSLRKCRNIHGIEFYVHPATGIGYKDLDLFTQIPATYFKIVDHFPPQSPSKENGYNRGLHGGEERAYADNLGGAIPDPRLAHMDQAFVADRSKGTIEPIPGDTGPVPESIPTLDRQDRTYRMNGAKPPEPVQKPELSDEAKCPYSRGEVLRVQGWKGLYVVNRIRKNEVFVLRLHEDGTLAKHTEAVPWPNLTIVPTRLFYYFEADTSTGFSTDDPNHDAALIAAHG